MLKSAGTSDWLGYFTTMIVIGCYGEQVIVIVISRCDDVGKEVVGGLKVNEDREERLRGCFSCMYMIGMSM